VGALLTTRGVVLLPILVWLTVPRLAGVPLRWVLWMLTAFTTLNFALGVEQNRLPSDHILNRYADADMQVVVLETGVRATGTFAYIAGLGVISAVGIWAGMAFMTLARNQRERVGAWVALATGFGCGLASISRGPIMIGAAMVGGWLLVSRDRISLIARGLVMGAFCLIVAMAMGLTNTFSYLGQGLMERHAEANDSFNERAFGQFDETVDAVGLFPLGHGFGSEQIGGQYYSTGEAGFNHFENAWPRMTMETGVVGLIGYLVIFAGTILSLQAAKQAVPNNVKPMLLATQLFLLPFFFYGGVIFNHTASAFTWLILAAVLAATEISMPGNAETQSQTSELGMEARNEKAARRTI
jgi:4-amino-4-deoxy-L-arabinose transferase-like glycosyltransferase